MPTGIGSFLRESVSLLLRDLVESRIKQGRIILKMTCDLTSRSMPDESLGNPSSSCESCREFICSEVLVVLVEPAEEVRNVDRVLAINDTYEVDMAFCFDHAGQSGFERTFS